MTSDATVQLIASVTTVVTTLITAVVAIKTHGIATEVKHATDGMKSELVESTKKASHLEGMQDQREKDVAGGTPPG